MLSHNRLIIIYDVGMCSYHMMKLMKMVSTLQYHTNSNMTVYFVLDGAITKRHGTNTQKKTNTTRQQLTKNSLCITKNTTSFNELNKAVTQYIPFQTKASEENLDQYGKVAAVYVLDHMYRRSRNCQFEELIAPLTNTHCCSVAVSIRNNNIHYQN